LLRNLFLKVLGVFLYNRRRRRRQHKYSVKDPGIAFNRDVFAEKPASPSSFVEFDKYVMTDFGKASSVLSPVRPQYYRETTTTFTFDDNIMRRQPPSKSPFKIANVDKDEKMAMPTLAFPEPLAEKKRRSPRPKPTWLSPITIGEEVRSPPLAYGMSSPERETFFPVPPQRPPQMAKATLVPTTPRSRASLKSLASSQSLIIPDYEPLPVISPARSASFAPKDLDLPSSSSPPQTPPANLTSGSTGGQIGSSHVVHDENAGLAPSRLMTVVARYSPNLPDELQVKLGDVVRVIAEYKDGWCFAQLLGTIDAPKGVVPLVCLQSAFTVTHKVSNNKSLTTWR
jgi:Variant SH3 domain